MLFGLKLSSPTEFDLFDTTSNLVQLQRAHASRRLIDPTDLG